MLLKLFLAIISLSFLYSCAFFRGSSQADFSTFDAFMPVPFHAQKDITTCGLAAAEMIADFYGKTLDAKYGVLLEKEAKLTGAIQAASLKGCLEASGFDVAVFPGTPDNGTPGIYRHLELKRPLIILLAGKTGNKGHYAVVNGYKKNGFLALIDPENGQYPVETARFLPLWNNGGNLSILALPTPKK